MAMEQTHTYTGYEHVQYPVLIPSNASCDYCRDVDLLCECLW